MFVHLHTPSRIDVPIESGRKVAYSQPVRNLPLLLIVLLVIACGSQADKVKAPHVEAHARTELRQPTARERTQIGVSVKSVWNYESHLDPHWRRALHLPNQHLHPAVLSIRVSEGHPAHASALVELRDSKGRRRPGTAFVVLKNVAKAGWVDPGYEAFEGPWQIQFGPAPEFPGACASSTPKSVRRLLCPSPWSVMGYTRPRDSYPTYRYALPLRSPNLRDVDWKNITLPGAACGSAQPIQIHRNFGYARSATDPWWAVEDVTAFLDTYGDLDGNGRDEAAVDVMCANNGGTASGQLASSVVVFAAHRSLLRVVGIIRPRQPFAADVVHVPLVGHVFGKVRIRRGEVVANELWYGSECCAMRHARTIWKYRNGKLRPARTVVRVLRVRPAK